MKPDEGDGQLASYAANCLNILECIIDKGDMARQIVDFFEEEPENLSLVGTTGKEYATCVEDVMLEEFGEKERFFEPFFGLWELDTRFIQMPQGCIDETAPLAGSQADGVRIFVLKLTEVGGNALVYQGYIRTVEGRDMFLKKYKFRFFR